MKQITQWVASDDNVFTNGVDCANHEALISIESDLNDLFETDHDSDVDCWSQDSINEIMKVHINELRNIIKRYDDKYSQAILMVNDTEVNLRPFQKQIIKNS